MSLLRRWWDILLSMRNPKPQAAGKDTAVQGSTDPASEWQDRAPEQAESENMRLGRIFRETQACPDCQGTEFEEGPSGGLAVNIRCCQCGQWFNVVRGGWFAERIDQEEAANWPTVIRRGQGQQSL